MMRAIVAVDEKWGIGRENKLLFSVPKDMAFFRETTKGAVVVMGRKTLESFPGGRPLKNRVNVVLTRDKTPREGCLVANGVAEAFEILKKQSADIFVIGGSEVYRELLSYCGEVYVTKIEADGGADAFFPDLDKTENFSCVREGEREESNGFYFRFTVYKNAAPIEWRAEK